MLESEHPDHAAPDDRSAGTMPERGAQSEPAAVLAPSRQLISLARRSMTVASCGSSRVRRLLKASPGSLSKRAAASTATVAWLGGATLSLSSRRA